MPTTTSSSQVVDAVDIPVVASGGFSTAGAWWPPWPTGASGIAMGTASLLTSDSLVPQSIKQVYLDKTVTDTLVTTAIDGVPQRVLRTELAEALDTQHGLGRLRRSVRLSLAFQRTTGTPWRDIVKEGLSMRRSQDLSWGQVLMAANTPMLLSAGLVGGVLTRGTLASGQVTGVLEDLPTCAELIRRIVGEARRGAAPARAWRRPPGRPRRTLSPRSVALPRRRLGYDRRRPRRGAAMSTPAPLDGILVIEASALGPAAITMPLVDLGARVVKVEPPSGDYIREMTWPIVEGVSLMHLHINRGKESIVLDLRTEAGVSVFGELAARADVVVEAMRPGGLARRGLGFEDLRAINPKVVFCTISGYGMTGPYKDFPAHGIAFDTWAGIVNVAHDEEGYPYLAEHASIGIHAGPLFGALGILAAVIRARATGEGSFLEIAQSDAAAAMDWYRSETWLAYRRPESEVSGNKADDYERRAPGTAGMKEGVRYQVYEASDGRYVLFMASEQSFWRNFCEAVGRMDLFERWPGSKFADHAGATASSRPSWWPSSPPRRRPSGSSSAGGPIPPSPRSTPRAPSSTTPSSRSASRSTRPRSSAPSSSRGR